ncbi:alkaline phosphatase d [Nannochloropsis oceanica]
MGIPMLLGMVLLCSFTGAVVMDQSNTVEIDGHYENQTLTRLAFGSCNKQWRTNLLWNHIVDFRPQAYLWLGDAVYVKEKEGDNEANLRKAYARQLKNEGYQRLLHTGAVIEGVYDDHDMSTNDGHRVNYTPQRQAAYLDFLGHIPPSSPRRSRLGLFSSHVFGVAPQQVKIIFMDVRSLSDNPALNLPAWIADFMWPVKPYLLALTRWTAVLLGVTKRFQGDMLGAEQWAWLEGQLEKSEASMHILVSSVQLLSVNPIVEGWGHYPAAQARLLALLRKYRPRGLVVLSGDVHFSELLVTQPEEWVDEEEGREALEVTSSGMTHTCFATTMGMCEMAVQRYDRHRLSPSSVYGGLNYGTVEVDWEKQEAWVDVRNKRGESVLQTRRRLDRDSPGAALGEPWSINNNNDLYFFILALMSIALVTYAVFWVVRGLVRWKGRRFGTMVGGAGGNKANKYSKKEA